VPTFYYEAFDGNKKITGEVEATNKAQAVNMLKTKGLVVVKIHLKKEKSLRSSLWSQLLQPRRIKLKDREIAVLSRQLGSLLLAGISLVDAISTLADEYKSSRIGQVLAKVYDYIVNMNMRFASALKKTESFPVIYTNLVRVAEETGTLDSTLLVLATFYERRAAIREKLKSAMIYPIMVGVMSIAAILVFMLIVVPKLKTVYSGFGKALPSITQFVINASDFIYHYWLWLGLGVVALYLLFKFIIKTSYKARFMWHKFLLRIPLVGSVLMLGEIVQAFRAFYTLFSNGVPIVQSLELSTEVIVNEYIKQFFIDAKGQLEKGVSLSKALEKSDLPGVLKVMIRVGEQSGSLDTMIKTYLDMAEEELNIKIDRMIAAIEPLSTIIVGTIVLVILLAMYLPIFSMTSIVKGK
jgi:type IV pilus assembly protein PilC